MIFESIARFIYHRIRPMSIRSLVHRSRLKRCGSYLLIGRNVEIKGHRFITIGNNVVLHHGTSLNVHPLEDTCKLSIGNGVQIGKYNDYGCSNKILIEDKVITAPYVHITDRDHAYHDIMTPIMDQNPLSKGPVIIKRGCWIGYGVQIMSNVTIGEHSVIAAGSIVTKNIPPFSIAAGNPAKIIKKYNPESKKWEKI